MSNISAPDQRLPDEPEIEETEETGVPDWDPTEYIPVMRHHLHDTLLSIHNALGKQSAEDIAEAYRDRREVSRTSKLSEQLMRVANRLEGYLGFLDEEDEDERQDRDSISEDE
jgi:hypothetical protein